MSGQWQKNQGRERARGLFWSEHDRAKYTCPDCGRGEAELRNGFEVHHTDGNPLNNDTGNLVGLCRVCHTLREGKKPSKNDVRYLVSQLGGTVDYGGVPILTTDEEYRDLEAECDRDNNPFLGIDMTSGREWCRVEIDFIFSDGWKVLKTEGTDIRLKATLSEDAVDTANRIVSKYKDAETHPKRGVSSWLISDGFGYFGSPRIRLGVARQLASELEAVVMDRDNWRLANGSQAAVDSHKSRGTFQSLE